MRDWLDDLGDRAKSEAKRILGGLQGEINFGGGDTTGSITIGQRPGISWPWAFGLLFVLVLVLAWRGK